MAEVKQDPIYFPRVVTIEGYSVEDLTQKVADALASKRFKGWSVSGPESYDGNAKMWVQGIHEKEADPAPGDGAKAKADAEAKAAAEAKAKADAEAKK